MHPELRKKIVEEFGATVTMGPDRVLEMSNRIQRSGKRHPGLVRACKFGRSMQVRRLKTISAKNWNPTDWKAAESILEEIAWLRKHENGPVQALGLAVLGVEVKGLEEARAMLEAMPEEEQEMGEKKEMREMAEGTEVVAVDGGTGSAATTVRASGKRK